MQSTGQLQGRSAVRDASVGVAPRHISVRRSATARAAAATRPSRLWPAAAPRRAVAAAAEAEAAPQGGAAAPQWRQDLQAKQAEALSQGRNILVAVDSSPDSRYALRWAVSEVYRPGDERLCLRMCATGWSAGACSRQLCLTLACSITALLMCCCSFASHSNPAAGDVIHVAHCIPFVAISGGVYAAPGLSAGCPAPFAASAACDSACAELLVSHEPC